MTVPDQNGKAEEFAAEAVKYLGQGGGAETTAVWAALAQVYATLAVASAARARSDGGSRHPGRGGAGSRSRPADDIPSRGAAAP